MRHVLERAWERLQRDRQHGDRWSHVAWKTARYATGLATARLFLLGVDEVGAGVRTEGRPRIENHGFISIGAHTLLRSVNVPVELATFPGARLEIGEECSINYGTSLGCASSITLGRRCRLGPYVMIVDSAFHELHDRGTRPEPRPVVIEDDVWIGAKASVLPGVTVGRGAVIGVGAVVTKDVAPFTVVAGVPAKMVKLLDPGKFVTAHAVV